MSRICHDRDLCNGSLTGSLCLTRNFEVRSLLIPISGEDEKKLLVVSSDDDEFTPEAKDASAWFAVSCTTMLLMPPAVFSAEDSGQSIEALLRTIEQKIATDHTTSPAGDSAIDAWKQVLRVIPSIDPVRVRSTLTIFVSHMRRRAAEEENAGNGTVAADMSVFASQAEGLTTRMTSKPDAPPRDAREALSEPPKFEPLAGSLPPLPPPGHFPTKLPNPGRRWRILACHQHAVPSVSAREFYASRGDQMLAAKDISAARKFYEYGANAGSPRAADALAKTYDAAFIAPIEVEPEAQTQARSPRRSRVPSRACPAQSPVAPEATAPGATLPSG